MVPARSGHRAGRWASAAVPRRPPPPRPPPPPPPRLPPLLAAAAARGGARAAPLLRAPRGLVSPAAGARHGRHRPLAVRAAAAAARAPPPPERRGPLAAALAFADANFIPVALLSVIAFGWAVPAPGVAAAALNLQPAAAVGIFFISGLLLRRGEAAAALRARGAFAYGLAAILVLTPALSVAAARAPLAPRGLAIGLAVFACMPTSLSTCVALTAAAGGNAALALALVVASNVAGVFTMPLALSCSLGRCAGLSGFSPAALFASLASTVLAPLAAGAAAAALVPGAAAWRDRNRRGLAYASAALLCLVPWMQLSRASAARLPVGAPAVASAVAGGAALHVAFLALNAAALAALGRAGLLDEAGPEGAGAPGQADEQRLRRERREGARLAALLCSSQKTLPVAVAVLGRLGDGVLGPGGAAYAVLACIAAHLVQTLIDSVLVSRYVARGGVPAAAAAAAGGRTSSPLPRACK